jgi:hypothetical protein
MNEARINEKRGACELIFKCFDEIILFLEIHMNNYTISQKGGNF